MKTNSFKKLVLAGMFATAFANVEQASADIYFKPDVFLGSVQKATDVYGVSCPINATTVKVQVGNKLGGFAEFISVQLVSPNGRAVTANSRENVASETVELLGGPGNYLVTVHKSASNSVEPYNLFIDCFDRNGKAIDGDQSTLVQNQ